MKRKRLALHQKSLIELALWLPLLKKEGNSHSKRNQVGAKVDQNLSTVDINQDLCQAKKEDVQSVQEVEVWQNQNQVEEIVQLKKAEVFPEERVQEEAED